jgi:Spy/CpxP family protein refolding chaperone
MTHLAILRNPRPLVVLLAALLALPALALAQPPAGPPSAPGPGFGPHAGGPGLHGFRGGPGGRGPFGNLGFVADFLDLTDEQREQARSLREDLMESHRALWEQTRTLRQELRAALDEETPDTAHIGELTLALHEQRQKARALREQALSDFEALLTADQLETFQQLRQTVQERRRERREFRRQRWEERRGGRPDGA